MPNEKDQNTEQQINNEIEKPSMLLTEENVERFQLGYRIFLGLLILMVIVNILIPLFLRRDPEYTVKKTGCYGIDVNNTCIGITKYSREVRKSAEFEEQPTQ